MHAFKLYTRENAQDAQDILFVYFALSVMLYREYNFILGRNCYFWDEWCLLMATVSFAFEMMNNFG